MNASLAAAAITVVVGLLACAALVARWVPHGRAEPVDDADIDRDFSPQERERDEAFRRRVRPWGLAGVAFDVAVPTALVAVGAPGAVVGSGTRPWPVDVALVVVVLLGSTWLAGLPGGVVVRRACLDVGLAAGSWGRWWRDRVVAGLLGAGITVVALVGWIAAARLWPTWWWLPVAVVGALAVVAMSFLVPVVIEPLFATVAPMAEGPLRTSLLQLAADDGIAVRDVLVSDASRRSTALNAYVSGLGATRRIVVHDTLVDRGIDEETRAVVAHELGHVSGHDVRTGTVLGAIGAVVGVAISALLLSGTGWLTRADATSLGSPQAAGLLVVLGAWAALLSSPLSAWLSRRIERGADEHCLELTRDPATVARMQRALAVTNLAALHPPRLLHVWFGTHPTSPERIAAARRWARDNRVDVPDALVPDRSAG